MTITRYAACLEYAGERYSGWQIQSNANTIQSELEKALSAIADTAIHTICAGRTDRGVHACQQVVHFDSGIFRKPDEWLKGGNHYLPEDIKLYWVGIVDQQFSARYSAKSRQYRYIFFNSPHPTVFFPKRSTWVQQPLNIEAMQKACKYLIGEQDFSSFQAAGCQSQTAVRHIIDAQMHQSGSWIIFDIHANSFLYHMVRNIAGTLITVGKGKKKASWIEELLTLKDRRAAEATAPAEGLYLSAIHYPSKYGICPTIDQYTFLR